MGINSNMASREVCDLIFVDYATKKPFLNLDYANVTTTELTGESLFAYGGKGHPKKVQFSGERGGTLTIETQMQSVKLWQLITGGELNKNAKFVKRVEAVTVGADSSTITLDEAPVAGSVNVFAAADDCGEEMACTVSDKVITLTAPVAEGTKVVVYYMAEVTDKVATHLHQSHQLSQKLCCIRRHRHEDRGRRTASLPPDRLQGRAAVQHVLKLLQQRRSRKHLSGLRPDG